MTRLVSSACRAGRLAIALMGAVLALAVIVPSQRASADDAQYIPFYTPPDPLPAGNVGDVIKSEPARRVYEPSGQLGSWVASGTRIMYRTTNAKGQQVAATGMYLEPTVPWPGKGPRPLIEIGRAHV